MPAEIKKREKYTGPIRKLDKSAILSHRIKEMSVKTREAVMRNERDDTGGQNRSAASSAADRMTNTAAESVVISGHASEQAISRAYRRYGEKKLIGERQAVRLADAEVDRNSAEVMNSMISQTSEVMRNEDRAKRILAIKGGNRRIRVDESAKPAVSAEQVQQYRKRKAIREIVKRNEHGGARRLLSVITGGSPVKMGAAAGSGRLMRRLAESTKSLLNMLTAGGAAALMIIVIMIFCGFGFTMVGDENGDNFAYDFYEIGSGDTDIVKVAEAQLGNVGGDKFWKWYGFNSHVHWCACFVSWCGNQCGYIKAGIIPKFAVVGNGASWFKARHRWASGGYSPKPGDVIFFDWDHDGVLDHVGLVEACDGKTVTTIEGNSGNACKRQTYRRGAASIAGYGLVIIPGGGSKAQLVAGKAIQLAYTDAAKEAKYPSGKPTAAYREALNRAYPNRSSWGKPSRAGASCDVFVGVCLVDCGVDKDFPRKLRDQEKRLNKRTDLYKCVISTTSRDVQKSELKDGDICTWEKPSGKVHIWIFAGGKARQASHDKWYPRTTSVGNNLKISGKKVIRVYRIKG